MQDKEKEKGLYKYVYDGKIIYIGMSLDSIGKRIRAHSMEKKFRPYLRESKIYWIKMNNDIEIKNAESLLINKYKPVLNGTDIQHEGYSIDIETLLDPWKEFEYEKKDRQLAAREIKLLKRDLKSISEMQKCIEHDIEYLRNADIILHMYEYNQIKDGRTTSEVLREYGITTDNYDSYHLMHYSLPECTGREGPLFPHVYGTCKEDAIWDIPKEEIIREYRDECLDHVKRMLSISYSLSDNLYEMLRAFTFYN